MTKAQIKQYDFRRVNLTHEIFLHNANEVLLV